MSSESNNQDQTAQRTFWNRITGRKPMAVVAITSLLFAAFGYFFPSQNWPLLPKGPELTFEIISETDVLDLHRPLDGLNIVFRGQDLQEQNLNLRIITINVENSGATHIRINDYDDDDWGLNFQSGEVIEARLLSASAEYLVSNPTFPRVSSRSVQFPKTVFDKGDSFIIEILLLHPERIRPAWQPMGKIAGVKEIQVEERLSPSEERFSVSEFFLSVARLVAFYVFGLLIGYWILPLLSRWIASLTRRRRNHR